MRNYSSIAGTFNETVWAITPGKLEDIRAFLQARLDGREVPHLVVNDYAAATARRPNGTQVVGKIGVVSVLGTISQRVGMLERSSGGISTEELGHQLEDLAGDRAISSILMVFDSPGGSVAGTPELADKIHALTAKKRIVGLADSMAASAAYWLLSQCSEVNVAPSSLIGSIGVLCSHVDYSKMDAALGAKTTIITSAPYKAEGSPHEPLSADARAEMQSKVNHFHGEFVKAVARGRGVSAATVNGAWGQGRMVTSREAVNRGMADKVSTLDAVMKRMGMESDNPARADRASAATSTPTSARADLAAVDRQLLAMQLSEMESAEADGGPTRALGARVDLVGRVLYGCEVARVGKHVDADLWMDRASIEAIAAMMRADPKGIRSRLSHPKGPQGVDPVDRYLGRFRNARAVGDRVLADLHVDPSSSLSPSGNLGGYVLERASSDSTSFSASLVLSYRRDRSKGCDVIRPQSIMACDIVDFGAFTGALLAPGAA